MAEWPGSDPLNAALDRLMEGALRAAWRWAQVRAVCCRRLERPQLPAAAAALAQCRRARTAGSAGGK